MISMKSTAYTKCLILFYFQNLDGITNTQYRTLILKVEVLKEVLHCTIFIPIYSIVD